ncbi:hypothetical protein KY284_007957 [Solanum tuberosum]|nr:hypothetical protein KY284_007957 [Solanum tuberosum]
MMKKWFLPKNLFKNLHLKYMRHNLLQETPIQSNQGKIIINKARLVVQGYNQEEVTLVDYSCLLDDYLAPESFLRAPGPMAQVLADLNVARGKNRVLQDEVYTLWAVLEESQGEVSKLKE